MIERLCIIKNNYSVLPMTWRVCLFVDLDDGVGGGIVVQVFLCRSQDRNS